MREPQTAGPASERKVWTLTPWRGSYRVPKVEAGQMELRRAFAEIRGHVFHHELIPPDRLVAGVAGFAIAGLAPYPRAAVVRQPTIGQFAFDQRPNGPLVHDQTVLTSNGAGYWTLVLRASEFLCSRPIFWAGATSWAKEPCACSSRTGNRDTVPPRR